MDAEAYLRQFQAALPVGAAWPRAADATLTQLLAALAGEFARADARSENLVDESDPRGTVELLIDWERAYGLPAPCMAECRVSHQGQPEHSDSGHEAGGLLVSSNRGRAEECRGRRQSDPERGDSHSTIERTAVDHIERGPGPEDIQPVDPRGYEYDRFVAG